MTKETPTKELPPKKTPTKELVESTLRIRDSYKGLDGTLYTTSEACEQANQDWKRQNLLYIGKDGRYYSTAHEQIEADKAWLEGHLYPRSVKESSQINIDTLLYPNY